MSLGIFCTSRLIYDIHRKEELTRHKVYLHVLTHNGRERERERERKRARESESRVIRNILHDLTHIRHT